ncbi:MAG TPA: hypothetical protein PKA64_23090, partial [Myxococcota bacterium]|nr:hypothetical protein [Myxococcota bacterium]
GRAASAVSESGAGAWFKDNIWHTRDGKDARKVGRFLTPEDSDEMLTRTKTSFDQDDQGGNAHIAALRQRAPGEALALQERLRGNRRGRAADDLTAAATSDTDAVNKDLASKQMKALGVAAADPKARDKLHAQFDW